MEVQEGHRLCSQKDCPTEAELIKPSLGGPSLLHIRIKLKNCLHCRERFRILEKELVGSNGIEKDLLEKESLTDLKEKITARDSIFKQQIA